MCDFNYEMSLKFNLQFFDGEKTEKATSKKRDDLRKKGQVVQTKDINTAVSMLMVFLGIAVLSVFLYETIEGLYFYIMDSISITNADFDIGEHSVIFTNSVFAMMKMTLPLLAISLVSGLACSYAQVGILFTTEPLKFKLEKISVIKGFKRLFSLKSLAEMIKSILKTIGVIYIAYAYIKQEYYLLFKLPDMEVAQAIGVMWGIVFNIAVRTALFLMLLAFIDYGYKYWQNEKDIMMSKQEVKEEYKQMEGDPQVKAKIREKQRQMAMSRMMNDVPDADVIITNPTHFAVALKYDREKREAPYMLAKGADLIAQKIKSIASDNDIPIVENKPLARALYDVMEIGDVIPEQYFEAVADVLAYVYKLKNRSV